MDAEASALEALQDDDARLNHVQEVIEEEYFGKHSEWLAETDKSWDAMHRCLAQIRCGSSETPTSLGIVILGGRSLYSGDDYIMVLKSPEDVRRVGDDLASVSRNALKSAYDRIDALEYGMEKSDQDFDYTWEWFVGVQGLWRRAASERRWILFTVDQ